MSGQDLEQRVRSLEDREAIRELKARYFACCDRKDPAGMRACFADGRVHIDYGAVGTFDSADALATVFRDVGCHEHMVEMHHGANPQITLVDGARARGTWSLKYQLIDTNAKRLTQLAGHYEDEYVKTAEGWRISRTRFVATSTLVLDLAESAPKTVFAGRP